MIKSLASLCLIIMITASTTVCAEKQPQTEGEKFSYAVGVQISQNLLRQGLEIDTESFKQAVEDVLNKQELKLTIPDMQQVMMNFQQKQSEKMGKLAAANKSVGERFLADNRIKTGVVQTSSGLQYKIIEQGNGKKPKTSDKVTVHYEGRLIDGQVFDSSYQRGEPTSFPVNGVIAGWTEALQLMPVGSKWQLYIPSELAYGERGAGGDIGPNATLIFDVELISID